MEFKNIKEILEEKLRKIEENIKSKDEQTKTLKI